jgi:8-oxo-dGTP diphosphatase
VRRALSLALDRRTIVERVLRGGQQPASRVVPPALHELGPTKETVSLLDAEHGHNPEAARALLAAVAVKGKDFPRLELTAWSPSQVPVLEAAKEMWRQELGIDTDPAALVPATFASARNGDRHMLLLLYVCRSWQGDPQPFDATALTWLRPSEMHAYAMPPADVPLIPILERLL